MLHNTLWNDQIGASGLFIDGDTNDFGIGTSSPDYKLDVRGDVNALR